MQLNFEMRISLCSSGYRNAESILRTIIKKDPDDSEINDLLGKTLLHLKNFQEAEFY